MWSAQKGHVCCAVVSLQAGHRLGLSALKVIYKQDILTTGPLVQLFGQRERDQHDQSRNETAQLSDEE